MPETPDDKAADNAGIEPDAHLGAIEGDRPEDPEQQGNRNVPALDEQGLPRDERKICEDVLGSERRPEPGMMVFVGGTRGLPSTSGRA